MIEQGTDAWKQLRLGKITASRVADILARTKTGYSTSRENYKIQLALEQVTGTVEQTFTNPAMQDGIDRESRARVAYELSTGQFVDQVPFIDHPTINGFGASPDGLVNDDGLIEIKCRNNANHWEVIKSDEIPLKYWIQMQTQMAVTGRKWNDYVGYNPNFPERSQLFIKRILRDEEFIAEIEVEVKKFLKEVEIETNLMRGKNEL